MFVRGSFRDCYYGGLLCGVVNFVFFRNLILVGEFYVDVVCGVDDVFL